MGRQSQSGGASGNIACLGKPGEVARLFAEIPVARKKQEGFFTDFTVEVLVCGRAMEL